MRSRRIVKGRGGLRPSSRPKPVTREEHRLHDLPGFVTERAGIVVAPHFEAAAMQATVTELVRTKDRKLPADPLRRAALVAEEAGEVLKAVLDATRGHIPGRHPAEYAQQAKADREHLRTELTHTAAMAIRVLGAMNEEDARQRNRKKKR